MSIIVGIISVIIGVLIYFLPSFIAFRRLHKNRIAILVLNIFLGWSLIGWIVALIWSFTN